MLQVRASVNKAILGFSLPSSLTFRPRIPVRFDVWSPVRWTNHTPQRDNSSLDQYPNKRDVLHLARTSALTVWPDVVLHRLVRMRDRHVDECPISRQSRGNKE